MTNLRSEKMDTACLALGRLIAGQCPPGFEKAVLRVDRQEGGLQLQIVATQVDGWEIDVPPSEEAVRNMRETLGVMEDEMAKEDPRPWKSCAVTLKKGGYFDLDVIY